MYRALVSCVFLVLLAAPGHVSATNSQNTQYGSRGAAAGGDAVDSAATASRRLTATVRVAESKPDSNAAAPNVASNVVVAPTAPAAVTPEPSKAAPVPQAGEKQQQQQQEAPKPAAAPQQPQQQPAAVNPQPAPVADQQKPAEKQPQQPAAQPAQPQVPAAAADKPAPAAAADKPAPVAAKPEPADAATSAPVQEQPAAVQEEQPAAVQEEQPAPVTMQGAPEVQWGLETQTASSEQAITPESLGASLDELVAGSTAASGVDTTTTAYVINGYPPYTNGQPYNYQWGPPGSYPAGYAGYAAPYAGQYPNGGYAPYNNAYTEGAYPGEGNKMHHTGKAAKKMMNGDGKYTLEDHNPDTYAYGQYNGQYHPGQYNPNGGAYAPPVTKKVFAENVPAATESLQDKKQRLQKYFEAEEELLAEIQQQDSGVSTYARPTGASSSRAAKYAANALKASNNKARNNKQQQQQQAAAQQKRAQPMQAGPAGKLAAPFARRPAANAPATTLSAPNKPTLKQPRAASGMAMADRMDEGTPLPTAGPYNYTQGYEEYDAEYYRRYGDRYADAYGYDDAYAYQNEPPKSHKLKKESKSVYNLVVKDGSSDLRAGFTTGATGTGTAGNPMLIQYSADLTCGASTNGKVGECFITGSAADYTADKAHVYITCTLQDDLAGICGVKYIPGMTLTAQGIADVTFDDTTPFTIESLSASALAITGTYVPSQRTTLLADVLSLLAGVKGGSLTFDADDTDGHFSFYLMT